MALYTTNYNLAKPTVGQNSWDTLHNTNMDTIDGLLAMGIGKEAAVAFSTTPVFDFSAGNVHTMLLTGNVTSSSVSNPATGLHLFVLHQDSTGGRTFTFPSSFKNAGTISAANGTAAANSYAAQVFCYIPSTGIYVGLTSMQYGE